MMPGIGRASLTDVDALTISMTTAPMLRTAPTVAATATTVEVMVNCLLKATVAVVLGPPHFRRVADVVLLAMAASILVALRVTH